MVTGLGYQKVSFDVESNVPPSAHEPVEIPTVFEA
jgi:hypothetical protein